MYFYTLKCCFDCSLGRKRLQSYLGLKDWKINLKICKKYEKNCFPVRMEWVNDNAEPQTPNTQLRRPALPVAYKLQLDLHRRKDLLCLLCWPQVRYSIFISPFLSSKKKRERGERWERERDKESRERREMRERDKESRERRTRGKRERRKRRERKAGER